MQEKIEEGDIVKRVGTTDYTFGRTGSVVMVRSDYSEARVRWLKSASGTLINPPNGRKTWVRLQDLELVEKKKED